MKDAGQGRNPADVFRPQAERRVRLGLVVAELVKANSLHAKPEQLGAHIDELAASQREARRCRAGTLAIASACASKSKRW